MLDHISSQSLAQVLAPILPRPPLVALTDLVPTPLRKGDILEIQGPPASGKTHLLYFILIECILPATHATTNLGGWQQAAIVMDTDGTFSVTRLAQLLRGRLARQLSEQADISSVLDSSLARLHVFQPTSSFQLVITIQHLPEYHVSWLPHSAIGVVAINSLSAFYWTDRHSTEQFRQVGSAVPGKYLASTHPMEHICAAIQSFHSSHRPLIALTNWGLHPVKVAGTMQYAQHLRPAPTRFADDNSDHPEAISLPLSLTCRITINGVFPADDQIPLPSSTESTYHQSNDFRIVVYEASSRVLGSFTLRISQDEMFVI